MLAFLQHNLHHFTATILAFLFAQIVIKGFRNIAPSIGFVDRPDRSRKLQISPIPLGGGVAVWLAAWTSWALVSLLLPSVANVEPGKNLYLGLAIGSFMILIVGIFDDLYGLRGGYKLVGQIFAASIPVALGLRIDSAGLLGVQFELGGFAAPAALLWIVLVINAFNLVDGMDGFCGSLGLIACTTLAWLAFQTGSNGEGLLEVALVGALVGFLADNLPPARIYMGDAGSMMIGLVVAVLSLRACGGGTHSRLSLLPLLSLSALPLIDVAAAIGRRWLTGRSLFSPDRGHLHHRLRERFGSTGAALAIGVALSSIAATGAGLALRGGYGDVICALFLGLTIVSLVGSGTFGVSELRLVYAQLKTRFSTFRSKAQREKTALGFKCHLQGFRDWADPWQTTIEEFAKIGANRVELTINVPRAGEVFHALWTRSNGMHRGRSWTVIHNLQFEDSPAGVLRVSGVNQNHRQNHLLAIQEMIQLIEQRLELSIAKATQGQDSHAVLTIPGTADQVDTQPDLLLSTNGSVIEHPHSFSEISASVYSSGTAPADHRSPVSRATLPRSVIHLSKFYYPSRGGIETSVRSLAQAQAALGCSVKVICMDHEQNRPTHTVTDGSIEVVRLRRIKSFAKLDLLTDLPPTLVNCNADLIHLHTPNPSMILALSLANDSRPLIITHHSDVIKQRVRKFLFRPFEKACYARARLILATSSPYISGSSLLQQCGDRVSTLPLGIDLQDYLKPSEAVEKQALEIQQKYSGPIWFAIGRLVYYKGFETAIRALQHVPGTLLIAGTGPEFDPLNQLVRSLTLQDRVHFLGALPEQSDVIAYYKAAHALWFPSNERSEAFGLVQVEAMASGCPVINTSIPGSGVAWVSKHEETGLTVPCNDSLAFAAAAKRILEESGLRERLVKAGRTRAVTEFDQYVMAQRSLEFYSQIIEEPQDEIPLETDALDLSDSHSTVARTLASTS